MEEDQIPKNYKIKTFRDRIIGGSRILPGRPQIKITTSGTFGEQDLRRQGARSGIFEGFQPGIGWRPSDTGGQ